jgi:hypothetical protein
LIKTRLAHGFCSRDPVAGACPYSNICEQCDNFAPDAVRSDIIAEQLDDIRHLRDDAEHRGWASETARHTRVVEHLERHLRTIRPTATP